MQLYSPGGLFFMTATASYRLARIAGGFRLSLSVHIIKGAPIESAPQFKIALRSAFLQVFKTIQRDGSKDNDAFDHELVIRVKA